MLCNPYGPIYIYGRYVSKALNNYDEALFLLSSEFLCILIVVSGAERLLLKLIPVHGIDL